MRLASDKLAGKALTKALDKRHDAAIQLFAKAKDEEALAQLWRQQLQAGSIAGAYWALMSHRHVTPELRQRAFGDVHMLSHLVGAANRADIRRLAALETENEEWRERSERQQERIGALQEERQQLLQRVASLESQAASASPQPAAHGAEIDALRAELRSQAQLVGFQALRREAAEQALAMAQAEEERLRAELEHAQQHNAQLARELHHVDAHLQSIAAPAEGTADLLQQQVRGKRILYVGGRPSSTPAMRKLVTDAGGEFVHHDGGLEDRKGLLAGALAGADLAAFPVDCIGHDAAGNLKRLCERHQVPFLALRTASATCLAAALAGLGAEAAPQQPAFPICLRHR